jgi:hypothetical protein
VPFDNDAVVIDNGAAFTRMLSPFDAGTTDPSRTCTVKELVPAVVGVPLIVEPVNVRPAGSDPVAIDQVYVPVPPLAESDCEYAAPTVPLASDAVETLNGAGFTRMLNVFDAVAPELSRTWPVKLEVPAALGFPEMTPPLLNVKPAGSEPALTVQVFPPLPPVAVNVCEYAVPTVPFARLPGETLSGAGFTLMLNGWLSEPPELSLTTAVKLDVPVVVGAPVITPPALIDKPAGRVPGLIENV